MCRRILVGLDVADDKKTPVELPDRASSLAVIPREFATDRTSFDDLYDDDTPTLVLPQRAAERGAQAQVERAILFDEPASTPGQSLVHADLFGRLERVLLGSHSLYPHRERVRLMIGHLSTSQQASRQGLELIIDGIDWCNFSSFEKDHHASEEQKQGSFVYFASRIAGLEKIKNRSADLREGVYWLYSLFEVWKSPLRNMCAETGTPHFASAIASSIPDLRRLLRFSIHAREIFEVYNRRVWRTPSLTSHQQLMEIARSLEGYKVGIPEAFTKIGKRIAYSSDMNVGLDIHDLLCRLPFGVHSRVLDLVSSGVDDVLAEENQEKCMMVSQPLIRFVANAVDFYRKYALDVANDYVDQFSNDYTPISVQHAMIRISEQMHQLVEQLSEPGLTMTETTGVHTTRMLEREEAAMLDMKETRAEIAAFTLERHNKISAKQGVEVAQRFLSTVKLFREVDDDGSRLLPFIKAYSEFVLGTADDAEQEFVGTILREIGSLVNYDRSWKKTFEMLIKKGPAACSPELKKRYKAEFGKTPSRVWDLRGYQRKLYEHPDAVQRFLAHANQHIDAELYDRFVLRMNDAGRSRLEDRIVLVGGGCGDARKELKLIECFEVEGIDVTLVLIDNSRYMRNRAALNCHEAGIRFPAILNRDIEKLTYEDLERDIDIQTQMIFFLGGGTPFNMMNRWYCYRRLREIFEKRYERRFGVSFGENLPRSAQGFLPDILVTEGDLEKSMHYYTGQDSLKFLSSGLEGEYRISEDAITVADGNTTLLISPTPQGLQFSYMLLKDQGPFKSGDVLLVIESGILNKKQFRRWLSGVGFDCEFMDGKYKNTLGMSRLCSVDEEYQKLVDAAIKEYENRGR